ncbi:N-acetyltransferase [Pseudomonas aeruginosa]|uniref:GNAT family N-acetyltransferase n=1 Tax=Pseudomonas aeruginosa TaxID=287 RepID=UPI000F61DEAB|nr:GNAT family N-acetyltransferase [Pseudomonas aeruginosa]RRI67402.1 N-acetyltransferase [Pseudomonas aeruginosa]
MIRPQDCEILQWRSFDDEAAFFASMGRFFASARVRRECGGHPLSDGPYHRWFVLRRQGDTRILGFVSLEQHPDVVRLRDAYLRAEARGRGLFRTLRERVLGHVDQLGLACTTRAPQACARLLEPHGFAVHSTRGSWVTLMRKAHGTDKDTDGASRGAVRRTTRVAACRAD